MESTKGFYKFDNDNWLYAPNYVESTGYVLIAEDKDQYTYPVDGWVWYDTAPIAYIEAQGSPKNN
jgi:hypothetical protein